MIRRAVAGLFLAVLAGCGAGSVNGTVAGVSLSVADAIFAVLKNEGKSTGLFLALTDKPDMCATLKANRSPKSATAIWFAMVRFSDSAVLAPDVADYTVAPDKEPSPGAFAEAYFSRTDANCQQTLADAASKGKSGIVKVTALKPEANGKATGTFDVTFGAGDKVTGSFNASYCDVSTLPEKPNCE